MDIPEFAFSVEDFLGPFPVQVEGAGEFAQEFNDLGDVVVVFAVFGAGLGVEEVVACDEFEDLCSARSAFARDLKGGVKTYHSRHAPDIGTRAPFGAEDDFWGSVLSGLDIVCEVVAHPARIAQICNLD